eukprot:maker-scaffold211_size255937-snap-gene-1.15 protein:Tk07170 transcript:maker-scaffold211_size255937-snap-gene-1.15-mRNA-1 annotation:"n-acetyllactosaminide beta- -n-acetylglucosaminyltransferase-like"
MDRMARGTPSASQVLFPSNVATRSTRSETTGVVSPHLPYAANTQVDNGIAMWNKFPALREASTKRMASNVAKMSRGLVAKRRCIEYAIFIGIIQLLLTVGSVWFFKDHPSRVPSSDPDSRFLLSVEYRNHPGAEAAGSSNHFGGGEKMPLPQPLSESSSSRVSYSVSSSTSTRPKPQVSNVVQDVSTNIYSSSNMSDFVINFNEERAFFDKSRMFKTSMFTVSGSKWDELSRTRQVCLGAQTSIDRASWLIEMVKTWSGPMSIALFTPDVEFHISKVFIKYLHRCFPKIKEQVSFHFLFPVDHPVRDSPSLNEIVGVMSCSDPKKVIDFLINTRSKEMLVWREPMEYPQNLLRNTAKSGCQTNFTFIPDIDMIPNPGLDRDLDLFLSQPEAQECDKCAYVVPTYEISTTSSHMPVNKTELLAFLKQKKARVFHQSVYTLNSKSSNLKKWEKIPMTSTLDVAYRVDNYLFKYEPLYVAKGNSPLFDERFIGFGMTRNTQAYEMYVSGYEFFVLNNAFTNHWGFQSIKTRPQYRAIQQMKNNARFDVFAKELNARYENDPYDMMTKLKGMNLKKAVVTYGNGKVPKKAKPTAKPKPAKDYFVQSSTSAKPSSSSKASSSTSSKASTTNNISSSPPETTAIKTILWWFKDSLRTFMVSLPLTRLQRSTWRSTWPWQIAPTPGNKVILMVQVTKVAYLAPLLHLSPAICILSVGFLTQLILLILVVASLNLVTFGRFLPAH